MADEDRCKVEGCRAAFPIRANRSTYPSSAPPLHPISRVENHCFVCNVNKKMILLFPWSRSSDHNSILIAWSNSSPGLVVFGADKVITSLTYQNHHLLDGAFVIEGQQSRNHKFREQHVDRFEGLRESLISRIRHV